MIGQDKLFQFPKRYKNWQIQKQKGKLSWFCILNMQWWFMVSTWWTSN